MPPKLGRQLFPGFLHDTGGQAHGPAGRSPLWSLWAQSIYYTPSFPTFQALSVFARSDAWLDYFGKGLLPLPEKRVYQEAFFTQGIWPL